MTNTITDAQAREMHAEHQELCHRVHLLTRFSCYGSQSHKDVYSVAAERDALFRKMLELRGVTFSEWVKLDDAQRKAVWGF